MCDKYGNLQFYTNGCVLNNREHAMMENGEIHVGEYTDAFCTDQYASSRAPQSILALPNFKHDSMYFVISQKLDVPTVNDTTTVTGTKLYLNKVDMRENQGLGKVVEKHTEILSDTLEEDDLQAVPHANGRDWWVIIPKFMSNCYGIVYLDAEGNTSVKEQCIGTSFGLDSWLGQSTFSPDGKKYVRFHWKYGLNIFDFDRCTGELSNPVHIPFPDLTFFRAGCAFSRSSRYLYATTHTKLFQFDMQAPDIATSRTFIADYDGFNTPFPTRFYMAGLALDGKVYVGCPGQHKHIHVIHEPEKPGAECQFEQHAVELFTSNFWSFPNLAHCRLGPMDGSDCDSLGLDNNPWAYFRWDVRDTLAPLRVAFTDLSAYEPEAWHWDFGDGATSQDTSPAHDYAAPGTYQVCLAVSNAFGADTLCRTVSLTTVAAEGALLPGYRVVAFPNPFRESFTLELPEGYLPWSAECRVLDLLDREVARQRVFVGWNTIGLGHLPPGTYFYVVRDGGAVLGTGKVLKTR